MRLGSLCVGIEHLDVRTNRYTTKNLGHHLPQDALKELMAEHRLLFPDFKKTDDPVCPEFQPWEKAGEQWTDPWGCVWRTGHRKAWIERRLGDSLSPADYQPKTSLTGTIKTAARLCPSVRR